MTNLASPSRPALFTALIAAAAILSLAAGSVTAGETTTISDKSTKSVIHPMTDFSVPTLPGL